ncbi:MAG TPA: PIN domain-containing protein [Kofleriaceae bacterium]|nr:PIN domain-containing protein [Kofleriaceae bacterium]
MVSWLFHGAINRLSHKAREQCESSALLISPMVKLELQLMFEIRRINDPGQTVIDDLSRRIGLRVADTRFSDIVYEAEAHSWTRDPFDRLIVATAAAAQAPLLTKDRHIRAHYPAAVWD